MVDNTQSRVDCTLEVASNYGGKMSTNRKGNLSCGDIFWVLLGIVGGIILITFLVNSLLAITEGGMNAVVGIICIVVIGLSILYIWLGMKVIDFFS